MDEKDDSGPGTDAQPSGEPRAPQRGAPAGNQPPESPEREQEDAAPKRRRARTQGKKQATEKKRRAGRPRNRGRRPVEVEDEAADEDTSNQLAPADTGDVDGGWPDGAVPLPLELPGGAHHEPVVWGDQLRGQERDEPASGATDGATPSAAELVQQQLEAEPPAKARKSREAAASIVLVRLHRPSRNEARGMVEAPETARAVLEAIPAERFPELAAAGGLLAYLETLHGPGRFRAIWIAKDLHTLASETLEVPDVRAAAVEITERHEAEENARRAAAREARQARRHEERQQAERQARAEALRAFMSFWRPLLPAFASALPWPDRVEALAHADEWLRSNHEALYFLPPETVDSMLRELLAAPFSATDEDDL